MQNTNGVSEASSGTRRRKFLSMVGAGAATGLISSVAVADPDKSAEEAGISNALEKLALQGKMEQVVRLCEQHNIDHNFSKEPGPSLNGMHGENEVGTQDTWTEGSSYCWIGGYKDREDSEGDEIYAMHFSAHLVEDTGDWMANPAPVDALAITWSDSYFQPVSQSKSNYQATGDSEHQSYKDYKRYGVLAEYDDRQAGAIYGDGETTTFDCGIRTEVEKLSYGNKYNINGEYAHTWNTSGAYYLSSISLGPVGISVNGQGVYDYRLEATDKV